MNKSSLEALWHVLRGYGRETPELHLLGIRLSKIVLIDVFMSTFAITIALIVAVSIRKDSNGDTLFHLLAVFSMISSLMLCVSILGFFKKSIRARPMIPFATNGLVMLVRMAAIVGFFSLILLRNSTFRYGKYQENPLSRLAKDNFLKDWDDANCIVFEYGEFRCTDRLYAKLLLKWRDEVTEQKEESCFSFYCEQASCEDMDSLHAWCIVYEGAIQRLLRDLIMLTKVAIVCFSVSVSCATLMIRVIHRYRLAVAIYE